jgi:glycine/D-amino acid oxidase-like deaminating enzyme
MRRHDVVVAGAGMAGLLTALALARRGAGVLVVERSGIGGGQSGQSHGYLHRGYAYGPDEPRLPPLFRRAGEHWSGLLAALSPATATSTVAFTDPAAVRRAERFWRDAGLDVLPRPTPGWLTRETIACFTSAEPTYHIGAVLHGLWTQARAAGVEFLDGVADRVAATPYGIDLRVIEPDGTVTGVAARTTVIAAGAGAPRLLARSRLPAVVQLRRAFMLVLRGELPAVSAVFPEPARHGLFLASRGVGPGPATWLASDFHSFDSGDGSGSGQLAGWWARRMLLTLRRVIDPAVLSGIRAVAGYPAVKSGLAPVSGTVAHEFGVDLFDGRAVVSSPAKLTLAPLAAQHAVTTVGGALGMPAAELGWEPVPPMADVPAVENWERPLATLDRPDLLGEIPDIGALSALYRTQGKDLPCRTSTPRPSSLVD